MKRIILFTLLTFLAITVAFFAGFIVYTPADPSSSITISGGWRSAEQSLKEGIISSPPQQILEVNLSYDEDAKPTLAFGKIQKKNGYAPTYQIPEEEEYVLEVLNSAGTVIQSVPFIVPNKWHSHGPLPITEGKSTNPDTILRKVDFTLTVASLPFAARVRIVTAGGAAITSEDTKNIPEIQNKPNFKSIQGDGAHNSKPVSLDLKNLILKAEAAGNGVLDITFIGDDYSAAQLGTFHNDVNRFTAALLAIEPFRSRASQIAFHYVDNTADLGCAADSNNLTLSCNNSLVYQQVNNSGAPYDSLIVIVNGNTTTGGSGGGSNIAVAHNGPFSEQIFVHELGHSLGKLRDEYVLINSPGAITGTTFRNCYAGTPPSSEWPSAVVEYHLGCMFPNWYRSSLYSVMNSSYMYFNAISESWLNYEIDYFVYGTDTEPPNVDIAFPVSGTTYTASQIVVLTATAIDNREVARVEFYGSGLLKCIDAAAPFECTWIVTPAENGTHSWTAKAYDVAGNSQNSWVSPVLTVNIPPIVVPPSAPPTTPPPGAPPPPTTPPSPTPTPSPLPAPPPVQPPTPQPVPPPSPTPSPPTTGLPVGSVCSQNSQCASRLCTIVLGTGSGTCHPGAIALDPPPPVTPPPPSAPLPTVTNPLSFTDLFDFLKWLLGVIIKIGIVLIALFIILSGFKFVKAQGNEKELPIAKTAFVYAIIGAAIILGGIAIASLIQGTVTEIGPPP